MLFNINTPIKGDESKEVFMSYKQAAVKCLRQDKYKQEGKDFPDNWKFVLTPWIVGKSPAYDLLMRNDIRSSDQFFDKLLERKLASSTLYSARFLDLILKIVKPATADAQLRFVQEFLIDFCRRRVKLQELDNLLELPSIINIQDEELRSRIVEELKSSIQKQKEEILDEFVEQLSHEVIMGMVSAEPSLFQQWDVEGSSPLTCTSYELADWIHTKLLAPKRMLINLRYAEGYPLVSAATNSGPSVKNQPQNKPQMVSKPTEKKAEVKNNKRPLEQKEKKVEPCTLCLADPAKKERAASHSVEYCFDNPNRINNKKKKFNKKPKVDNPKKV
jgi:hypothetical protein